MIARSFFENEEDVSAKTKRGLEAGLKNVASGEISLNRVELKQKDIEPSKLTGFVTRNARQFF